MIAELFMLRMDEPDDYMLILSTTGRTKNILLFKMAPGVFLCFANDL